MTTRNLLAPALLALVLAAPLHAQGLDTKYDPKNVKSPPLKPIPTLSAEHFTLPNGISVYLHEDHALPVVKGTFYVRSSPLFISADRVGLGTITGEVMRSGGTARHSGDWLDDHLASIGASIGTGITADLASATFRSLTGNTPEVIGLFGEVLRQPAFPEDKIELSKVGLKRAIAERNDELIPLLVRLSREVVWGKDHPYARKPEYATLEAIKRDDLQGLWSKVFEPSRATLAVYGDFRSADMKKLLTDALGSWKGTNTAVPAAPAIPENRKARLVFAPKDDVTQSGILLTQLGMRTDDPDTPAMDVWSMALGGGFQSRLVNVIRTGRGLAYATGAGTGDDLQHPGVFITYSLTKSESTLTALDLLRQETRRALTEPYTDQELETAKQSVLNLFVFNFEDPSEVLNRKAFYEAIGYPQDFLTKYQTAVQAVTAQSALAAAQRKIHDDQLSAIVVGKEKDFDRPLAKAGLPLERYDITIPSPGSKLKVGAATTGAKEQARAWLATAVEKAGGSKAWQPVKAVTLVQKNAVTMQGQKLDIESTTTWNFPDKQLSVQKTPMGEVKSGFDGTTGWRAMGGQTQDNPAAAQSVQADYQRSLFHVFAHPEELDVQALDPQTVDGVKYNVAFVNSDVVKDWTMWFAPDGSLARVEFQANGPQGPAKQTVVYSDWKPEAGLVYPHTTQVLIDGQPFATSQLVSLQMNPTLTAEAFKKPQ